MMTYGMLRGSVRTCVGDCRARVVLLQKVDHLSGSRRLRYSTEFQVTLLDGKRRLLISRKSRSNKSLYNVKDLKPHCKLLLAKVLVEVPYIIIST